MRTVADVRSRPVQLSQGSWEPGDLNAATNTARNLLMQPALGDWTIQSKHTTGAALTNVQVGLFALNGPATSADLTVAVDDFPVVNDRPRHRRR